MKRFDLDEFNKNFKSISRKVSLSEKERMELFNSINFSINDSPHKSKKLITKWKYYIASAITLFLLFVVVTSLLSNNDLPFISNNGIVGSQDSSSGTISEEAVKIEVINNTNSEIPSMELNIYQGEKLTTQGNMNANGSSIKQGGSFEFQITQDDIDLEYPVILEVIIKEKQAGKMNKEGETLYTSSQYFLNIKDKKEISFELTGDYQSGLILNLTKGTLADFQDDPKNTGEILTRFDNEMVMAISENITLGMTKEFIQQLIGELYVKAESESIDEEWQFNFREGDLSYFEGGKVKQHKETKDNRTQAQLYITWNEDNEIDSYKISFYHEDGKLYEYQLGPHGELIVEY
ncbi:hypothetical protein [Paucisalibacillus sp. EB02]|uniref:hypothetical protein n=1 Tax=Paucisalibacillus sp. EB02 TaxID=1347087 RepID=UPI0004B8F18B|nr:hypothetical protein [Paucisalibacillus sp. EB02]